LIEPNAVAGIFETATRRGEDALKRGRADQQYAFQREVMLQVTAKEGKDIIVHRVKG
jgi:hypothetical protein